MKSFLLSVILVVISFHSLAYDKKRGYKIYKHQALGIQIRYRNADDFDDKRRITVPFSEWKRMDVPQFKLKIKLPPGFVVRTEPTDLPTSGPICDSSLFRYSADIVRTKYNNRKESTNNIHIHFTNMEFPEIALDNNYVKDDSDSWASDAGMMGKEEASYLDGTKWKGLRGANFSRSGAYTQLYYTAFLVYKYGANCNLVLTFFDSQLDASVLSEAEFYDIVSSIELYNQ